TVLQQEVQEPALTRIDLPVNVGADVRQLDAVGALGHLDEDGRGQARRAFLEDPTDRGEPGEVAQQELPGGIVRTVVPVPDRRDAHLVAGQRLAGPVDDDAASVLHDVYGQLVPGGVV